MRDCITVNGLWSAMVAHHEGQTPPWSEHVNFLKDNLGESIVQLIPTKASTVVRTIWSHTDTHCAGKGMDIP